MYIIELIPRKTVGLCWVHIDQLITYPAVYTLLFTLQLCYKPLGTLQRVKESKSSHIKSWWITKLFNINFSYHRSKGFQEWRQSIGNLFFPHEILNLPSNRYFIFWLQSIHNINISRKPSFPMNVSLILTLIVQATLSLVQQVFIDSVNFIVQPATSKINRYAIINWRKKQ